MPTPYLAHSLVQLRAEVDRRWPIRDRSSDGWIGDASHAAQKSEHNPDEKGCVHAIDIDISNVKREEIVESAKRHPSTWYVISNGMIYSRRDDFAAEPYEGTNPHFTHVHVSILLTDTAERSTRVWLPRPTLKRGSSGVEVKEVQSAVGAFPIDGLFGIGTESKVKAYQKSKGLYVDGIVGAQTWKAITDAYA